jgi:hypothetical protein
MNIEDTIRREQFCQIKTEIRGSADYLVVGIDVAKHSHHAFMGTATGKSLLRKLIFENNLEGFGKLLERSEAIKNQNALCKVVFGLEPTGNYHKPLAAHLIGCGCHVVLVSGKAVKNNRELLDGRSKTLPTLPIWYRGANVFIMTFRHQISTNCGSTYRFAGV